jgi:transcriptional regulator with XRE-family HTH domain
MGLEPNILSRYEKDRREPDLDTLVKIVKYYRTTSDYLLGLTDNPARVEATEDDAVFKLIPVHARDRVEAFAELGEISDRAGLTSEQITRLIKAIAEVIQPPASGRGKSSRAAHMEKSMAGEIANEDDNK